MGKLYVPPEKEIIGPWLLGSKELEELDEVVEFIDDKLKISYKKEFNIKAQKFLDNGKYGSLEEAIEKEYRQYFKARKKKNIVLISNDETRLIDDRLRNILIDNKLKSFRPKELTIDIEYGYTNVFSFDVKKRFDGALKYKVRCMDSEIENEISYKIESWIENSQPNKISQLWNKYSIAIYFVAIFFLVFSLYNVYTIETPRIINVYQSEINKLLSDGINSENQYKATELLLKLNANYFPENIEPVSKFNPWAIRLAVFSILILLISHFKPKTTLGLGKHKGLLNYYKKYIKIIIVTIPSIFLLPYLIKLIKMAFGIE